MIMHKKYKDISSSLYSAISIMLFFSGCTLVPGSHINDSFKPLNVFAEDTAFERTFENDQINFIKITPLLIEKSIQAKKPISIQDNFVLLDQIKKYEYKIGIGDILNIIVWDHPELTIPAGEFRSAGESGNIVHSDGTIFYPYVGQIYVDGLGVNEVRNLLTQKLSKYIESPQLDISIASYRSKKVFVSGEVLNPVTIPITNVPLTILDAINTAGGISQNADLRSVALTRNINNTVQKEFIDLYALYYSADHSQNRLLFPDDIIHIPRNDLHKVFVMGDVMNPKTQIIGRHGLSLAEALSNVGGINETSANARGIFVLRSNKKEDKLIDVYQLDASVAAAFVLTTQFQLEPMDVIYVTSAPISRWNKIIQNLIPTISGLFQINNFTNSNSN